MGPRDIFQCYISAMISCCADLFTFDVLFHFHRICQNVLSSFSWNKFSQNELVDNKIIIVIFLLPFKAWNEDVFFTLYDQNDICRTWETFLKGTIPLIDFYSPNHILSTDGRFLDHHKSFMIESPSIWSWIFFFVISLTNIINEWINK